jgi:DNA processing protein
MLPVSRSRAAAVLKELCLETAGGFGDLDDLLNAVLLGCRIPPAEWRGMTTAARDRTARALRVGAASGMTPLSLLDERYPALLSTIPDPPPVLWIQGASDLLSRPTVAVVGSRGATPYALQVAQRLGDELAGRGMVVASGLARGVDSAAHRGCLAAGGATTAVLGSGLDRVYPAEHRDLALTISKQGVVVSELGPGADALPEHFPLRNRIISGISLAVVVVEASEKSGSLITARYALEQGRDVLAVPGSVLSGRNRGSHSLLKDGAKVVETADDILEELGWFSGASRAHSPSKSMTGDPLLARMEPGEVYRLEDLMALTGTSGPKLLARLTELELNGLVKGLGGAGFARVADSG